MGRRRVHTDDVVDGDDADDNFDVSPLWTVAHTGCIGEHGDGEVAVEANDGGDDMDGSCDAAEVRDNPLQAPEDIHSVEGEDTVGQVGTVVGKDTCHRRSCSYQVDSVGCY
jgi:hypothetical protein